MFTIGHLYSGQASSGGPVKICSDAVQGSHWGGCGWILPSV